MASASSVALRVLMGAIGGRFGYRDVGAVRRKAARTAQPPRSYAPPRRLRRGCRVTHDTTWGWPCYRFAPRDGAARAEVLYLHGGAYIEEIGDNHWQLVRQLATRAHARVTVPVYPLAPRGRAGTFLPRAAALAAELTRDGVGPTVFMGDSAGGGMAVALAQRLHERGEAVPDRLVLLSPWLDVVLDNPGIPAKEPLDPMLAAEPLRVAGALWAGDLDPADPLVSPLRGEPAGLPPTEVFTGTHEILAPDAFRFRDLATAAGVPVTVHEAPGQIHAYPLWPTPEGRRDRRRILELVRTADAVRAAGPAAQRGGNARGRARAGCGRGVRRRRAGVR